MAENGVRERTNSSLSGVAGLGGVAVFVSAGGIAAFVGGAREVATQADIQRADADQRSEIAKLWTALEARTDDRFRRSEWQIWTDLNDRRLGERISEMDRRLSALEKMCK